MDEAEYCDRVAVMDEVRVVVLDTPENLKGEIGSDVVTVTSPNRAGDLLAYAKETGVFASGSGTEVRFEVADGARSASQLLSRR